MKKPLGRIFPSIDKLVIPSDAPLVTVGDIVSCSALKAGLNPQLIFYDGKENRKFVSGSVIETLERCSHAKVTVSNPPGYVTEDLWNAVRKAAKLGKVKIYVIGEEDLAAIPAILLSAKGTIVLYGQKGLGIVAVEVDENIKMKLKSLLNISV